MAVVTCRRLICTTDSHSTFFLFGEGDLGASAVISQWLLMRLMLALSS